MKIPISQLRAIADKLFSHLESLGYDSVEISEDWYWNIPEEEKYVMENEPKDLNIGRLSDDWEFLQGVSENDDDPPISYALIWLGKILQVIGEKIIH